MKYSTRFAAATLALSLVCASLSAKPEIITPNVKSGTSFAIIIDKGTYDALSTKVLAYRDAIEKDGLATYIVADDFKTPEEVKEQISTLYATKNLEGVVFVGNIPVVMVRDGQHLASAFKMDQTRPWDQSSIPSDRFYDDFDLKFNFLKADEVHPNYFYYSLAPDSQQYIRSDIYSARVRAGGEDALKKIGLFLDKAVKAHAENNKLDKMFVFTGHGYNSEATDAWSNEHVALREQLPGMFAPGSTIRFARSETVFPLKNYLLEILTDENMDIVLGHHHGAPEMQYLNGAKATSSPQESALLIKRYLRSKVVNAKDKEKTLQMYMKDYDVPETWFDLSDSTAAADEAYDYMLDLYLEDIYKAKPNSRFVMLDACYNGSFHLDDCMADAYIFSEGRTVAVQGNSVNSLQDRLPDRYVGVLGMGASIGQWARINQTVLETHIIGDPTLTFASASDMAGLMRSKSPKTWTKILKDANAPAEKKTVALRMLRDMKYAGIYDIIENTYYTSDDCIVRNECFNLMADIPSDTFKNMVISGLSDSYELIRRFSADYLVEFGTEDLAPIAIDAIMDNQFSRRVVFHLADAVDQMDPAFMRKALEERYHKRANSKEGTGYTLDFYLNKINMTQNRLRDDFDNVIINPEKTVKKRMVEIRLYRNYRHHVMVPELIGFALDKAQDETLRIGTIEALGWFRYSYTVPQIKEMCNKIIADNSESEAVKNEAEKSLNRLAKFN